MAVFSSTPSALVKSVCGVQVQVAQTLLPPGNKSEDLPVGNNNNRTMIVMQTEWRRPAKKDFVHVRIGKQLVPQLVSSTSTALQTKVQFHQEAWNRRLNTLPCAMRICLTIDTHTSSFQSVNVGRVVIRSRLTFFGWHTKLGWLEKQQTSRKRDM